MARLQILELPEGSGDDRPPFILVVDQHQPLRYIQAPGFEPTPVDEFAGVAEQIGARTVLVFQESVEIPANEPPTGADDAEQAGAAQIVYAHERTRLDLCSALLLSGDTTWRKLVELAAERQRELAGLYRERDTLAARLQRIRNLPEEPEAVNASIKDPDIYRHAYTVAIRVAKFVARGADEEASPS
ncbi:hypothetical protein [Streptomyces sp. NBC_01373]|uniref:hypothetical protein n=1 Tax=Streptomyces sp. NBC_01373 TaxID=2903843 RepID=UPI0022533EFE|nr:hypothetical protein [Streptomyces sp. NBC_01373]MCX4704379.1 hypothetical protein [Streptomyces sp. NBC_01373]MCX4707119.1 hypothetical protein [Streptomyces sp. NBC_01373]